MKLTEHPLFAVASPSERARLIRASDDWATSSGEWPAPSAAPANAEGTSEKDGAPLRVRVVRFLRWGLARAVCKGGRGR